MAEPVIEVLESAVPVMPGEDEEDVVAVVMPVAGATEFKISVSSAGR